MFHPQVQPARSQHTEIQTLTKMMSKKREKSQTFKLPVFGF